MKSKILFILIAGFSYLSFSSFENGIAQFGGNRTGAGGSVTNCEGSGCHVNSDSSNLIVSIQLYDQSNNLVTDGKYIPNANYRIDVRGSLSAGGSYPVFGFQFAAGSANNGSYYITNNDLQSSVLGIYEIVEHKLPIPAANNNFNASFFWIAPNNSTGDITFYTTLLACNDDGFGTGDISQNTSRTFQKGSATSVASFDENIKINLFPNPVNDQLNIAINNAAAGNYNLIVYNLSGQIIDNKNIAVLNKDHQTTINTASWSKGMYLIEIRKDNARKILTIVKQ